MTSIDATKSIASVLQVINPLVRDQQNSQTQSKEQGSNYTIVFQVNVHNQSETPVNATNTFNPESSVTYKTLFRPVLKLVGEQAVALEGNVLTAHLPKLLFPGSLIAFQATGTNAIKINPQSFIEFDGPTQVELQRLMAQLTSTEENHSTVARLFLPTMRALQHMMSAPAQTSPEAPAYTTAQVHHTDFSSIRETLSLASKTAPPLDWLSQATSTELPEWLGHLKFYGLKSLHLQNISVLEQAMNQLQQQYAAQVADKPTNENPAKPQPIKGIYERPQILQQPKTTVMPDRQFPQELHHIMEWIQLQKRWLQAPESIAQNSQAYLERLHFNQLPSIELVHRALLHIWPEYNRASQDLLYLFQHQSQQIVSTHQNRPLWEQLLMFVTEDIEEDQHTLNMMRAMALRVGLAEVIQQTIPNGSVETGGDQRQVTTLPFSLVGENQQSHWIKVSIESQPRQDGQEDRDRGEKLMIEFETHQFGAIRFELLFPSGFNVLSCATHVWLEKTDSLALFQRHEQQLQTHLARLGLDVTSFQWKLGRHDDQVTTEGKKPRFHIDDYV